MAKLLVTDDSLFQRMRIVSWLIDEGFETVQAGSGLEALEILASEDLDLVICDLLMPDMDGFEFLEALKTKGLEIPVVIHTANIQSAAKERCETLGAKGFVSKTSQSEGLINAIRAVLERVES